ncbi:MAG: peptide chain release factor N(5)-glutamine methyltransferase [Bacteroides sp.]
MQKLSQYIKQSLSSYPEREAQALVRIIYQDVLQLNTLDIYLDKDINLSAKQANELEDILVRLQKHEPIQYIIGSTTFYGLKLKVDRNVLIPRPETAELVEMIIEENAERTLKIVDIGTGSGCIALSLSAHLPLAEVSAWDISEGALQLAKQNAEALSLKVHFEQRDALNLPVIKEKYDIIVSNPPYVRESEKAEMETNVLDWEPALALFVSDEDPLLFYRKIAEFGKQSLLPNGTIYFEINQTFGQQTKEMMEQLGYTQVEIIKDMFGKDRIAKAVR